MPQMLVSARPDWTAWISAAHSMTAGSTLRPSLEAMAVMISPSTPTILPLSFLAVRHVVVDGHRQDPGLDRLHALGLSLHRENERQSD